MSQPVQFVVAASSSEYKIVMHRVGNEDLKNPISRIRGWKIKRPPIARLKYVIIYKKSVLHRRKKL